jgi:hypothetical protein
MYPDYVVRCRTEDLEPLSREAWELVRHPITERSMSNAWYATLWMDKFRFCRWGS